MEEVIGLSAVGSFMGENGWAFCDEPGVVETVNMDRIKKHYYRSHESINPTRIVPSGPILDFTRPHERARLFA